MWGQSVEEGEGRSWGRGCPRGLVTGVAEQLHGPLHQLCPRPSFQVYGDAGCGHVTESGGLWAEVYNRYPHRMVLPIAQQATFQITVSPSDGVLERPRDTVHQLTLGGDSG